MKINKSSFFLKKQCRHISKKKSTWGIELPFRLQWPNEWDKRKTLDYQLCGKMGIIKLRAKNTVGGKRTKDWLVYKATCTMRSESACLMFMLRLKWVFLLCTLFRSHWLGESLTKKSESLTKNGGVTDYEIALFLRGVHNESVWLKKSANS